MTFRDYVIVMAVASSAAWLGWFVVLYSVDPVNTGMYGYVFFYLTLSVALMGTISLIGVGLRKVFKPDEIVSRHVGHAFRQSILFTALVIAALFLLPQGLFRWWTMGLVMLTVACIELALISSHRQKR